MPVNITGGISRFEAGDTRQFTLTATETRPETVGFIIFNTNGDSLALAAVQSGGVVQESGVSAGQFYFNIVLPDTPGYYTSEWIAWDSNSLPYISRDEFEIFKTEARSFYSYGDVADILRTARQIFGKSNITIREIQDYMEPADNWIDSKLGTIHTIPVSPVPPIIREINKTRVLWRFYSDKFGLNREEVPPGLKDAHDEADKFLTAVQSGDQVLHVTSGTVLGRPTAEISSSRQKFHPIFDSRDWPLQRIDPDQIDDDIGKDS